MTVIIDGDHRYWAIDGARRREVPGVSRILEATGARAHYGGPAYYGHRGHCVHKAAQLDHQGVLDEDTVDPEIRGYLDALRAFRENYNVIVLDCEKVVYCEELGYAGTLDVTAIIGGYRNVCVLDLKSGSPQPWHELQVAAYVLAHGRRFYRQFSGGMLYLKRDETYRLKMVEPLVLDRRIDEWRGIVRKYKEMGDG